MPGNVSYFIDHDQPLIIAHRGASVYAPENTLAAFELAVKQGADGIELDAQLTADGQVVVMHDDTVDRTTDGSGRVKSKTLAELKQLDGGKKFDPNFSGEMIPRLAEVFAAVGQRILINVELKNYTSPTDDLPDKVVELVSDYKLEDSVLLSSFNIIALIRARNILPDVHLGLLTFPGLGEATLRFKLIGFSALLAFHPHFEDVSPELVEAAHKVNCRVYTYTVKQPEVMEKMLEAGVDGIITPDPVMARSILSDLNK